MTGAATIVLFAPAADSLPPRPAFSRALDSDDMVAVIAAELEANGIGFTIL